MEFEVIEVSNQLANSSSANVLLVDATAKATNEQSAYTKPPPKTIEFPVFVYVKPPEKIMPSINVASSPMIAISTNYSHYFNSVNMKVLI